MLALRAYLLSVFPTSVYAQFGVSLKAGRGVWTYTLPGGSGCKAPRADLSQKRPDLFEDFTFPHVARCCNEERGNDKKKKEKCHWYIGGVEDAKFPNADKFCGSKARSGEETNGAECGAGDMPANSCYDLPDTEAGRTIVTWLDRYKEVPTAEFTAAKAHSEAVVRRMRTFKRCIDDFQVANLKTCFEPAGGKDCSKFPPCENGKNPTKGDDCKPKENFGTFYCDAIKELGDAESSTIGCISSSSAAALQIKGEEDSYEEYLSIPHGMSGPIDMKTIGVPSETTAEHGPEKERDDETLNGKGLPIVGSATTSHGTGGETKTIWPGDGGEAGTTAPDSSAHSGGSSTLESPAHGGRKTTFDSPGRGGSEDAAVHDGDGRIDIKTFGVASDPEPGALLQTTAEPGIEKEHMSEKQTDMSEKKDQQAGFLLEKKDQQASETVPAESLLDAENNNKDTGTEQKKEEKRVGLGWEDRVDFRNGDAEGKIG